MDGPPPRQWPADEQKEEWCAADPRQTFRLNRLTHRVELAGAPEIATPLRYQAYERVAPLSQVPACAVKVEPTAVVPVMVGIGVRANLPSTTTLAFFVVRVTDVYPRFEPVTDKPMAWPMSAATGT